MTHSVSLVGGPLDGARRTVFRLDPVARFLVPVNRPITEPYPTDAEVYPVTYVLESISVDSGDYTRPDVVTFYRDPTLPLVDALTRLIAFYRPPDPSR